MLKQLATAATDQYTEIKASLDALAAATSTVARRIRDAAQPLVNAEQRKLKRRIKTPKAAFKNSWVVGGFCSAHSHGVAAGHNSKTCGSKGAGHVDTATQKNPAGLGKDKNKGWDAWLP